jgi:hypothetical protein
MRARPSGSTSTSSSIIQIHSDPSSYAVRMPSLNPPDPPVLVSRRRYTISASIRDR